MIYYLCTESDKPAGGHHVIYQHVDILNAAGIPAAVLHNTPGYRFTWFENNTRTLCANQVSMYESDWIVVPETWGENLLTVPHIQRVIFNQNTYNTWGYPLGMQPYSHPSVKAVMVVSRDGQEYMQYAFPWLNVGRVIVGPDVDLFTHTTRKLPMIAWMPRKNRYLGETVFNMLESRGALNGWTVLPIDGVPVGRVAAAMKDAALFISTGWPEGCPVPPLEAGRCGCGVIGYTGNGAKEYFGRYGFTQVPYGEVLTFAKTVESAMTNGLRTSAEISEQIGLDYGPDAQRDSVLAFWGGLLK